MFHQQLPSPEVLNRSYNIHHNCSIIKVIQNKIPFVYYILIELWKILHIKHKMGQQGTVRGALAQPCCWYHILLNDVCVVFFGVIFARQRRWIIHEPYVQYRTVALLDGRSPQHRRCSCKCDVYRWRLPTRNFKPLPKRKHLKRFAAIVVGRSDFDGWSWGKQFNRIGSSSVKSDDL